MKRRKQEFINWRYVSRRTSGINSRTRRANLKRNEICRCLGLGQVPHELISKEELVSAFILSGGKCAWCNEAASKNHFDHIYPTSKGGRNIASNIAFACPCCNRRKAGKHPAQYAFEVFKRTGIKTDLLIQIEFEYGISLMEQRSLWLPPDVIYITTNKPKPLAA